MSPKARPLPFYNPIDPTNPKRWPDYTLLLPVCAVGNIGQFACDLIISTLLSKKQCQLIGRLYSPALMPVVGPNAFNLVGPPTTSTEVYESKKHKLVIIQQRTSYFKALKHLYIQELVEWMRESQFDKIIVLTSSFAQCNPDTSSLGLTEPSNRIQCLNTSSFDADTDKWKSLHIKQIPDKRSIKVVQDGLSFLPGSGITKPLWKACQRASIAATFLVDFCSEGLNMLDCYQVVNIVDRFLGLSCSQIPSDREHSGELNTSKMDQYDYVFSAHPNGDQRATVGWVQPYSWKQI